MAQKFLAPDATEIGCPRCCTATAWLALVVIAIMIYAVAMSLGQKLIGGEYVFTLPGNFPDNEVVLPDIGTATVVSASQSMDVNLTLTHVSGGIIALVILQHVFALALVGGIGGAIFFLCNQLLKGKPFVHSVTVVLTAMAIVLIVVGLGTDLTTNWLQALVQQEVTGGSPDTVLGVNWHFSSRAPGCCPRLRPARSRSRSDTGKNCRPIPCGCGGTTRVFSATRKGWSDGRLCSRDATCC